jgi:hypothetical protein
MSGIVGQNILDNSGLIKAPAGGGAWNFIKKLTASASGDLSFVDGTSDVVLDSTYKEYLFTFNNIHVSQQSGDGEEFEFNLSIDGGSNYNVTKTTTYVGVDHTEHDLTTAFSYVTSRDLAQGTGFQHLAGDNDADNDSNIAGTLHLFAPSDTTFVKHFIATTNYTHSNPASINVFVAGYGNTTSAVDAVRFQFNAGNIDAGDICLYGLTT